MQHRARDLLLRQQTQVINALRAHLAELGMVAAQGREGLKQLLTIIADEKDARLPIDARASLIVFGSSAPGAAYNDWLDREAAHCAASRK